MKVGKGEITQAKCTRARAGDCTAPAGNYRCLARLERRGVAGKVEAKS